MWMSAGLCEATDSAGLGCELARLFAELAPPGNTGTPMPPSLRAHLRTWWVRRFGDRGRLPAFVDEHRDGVVTTLRSAQHDPDARRLLSPEILLVLHALDEDPFSLLAIWPQDRDTRELLALADVFGRPYG
jgi:hypothetical protein